MRGTFRALSGILLLSVAGTAPRPADAAPRRWETQQEADLGGKRDTGLDESLKEDLSRQQTETREARPALEFDRFRRGVELKVAEKRHEQIQTLQRLVDMGAGEQELPDLLFRLSELYWEEAKYYSFQAHAKDDEIIEAGDDAAAIERLRQEQAQLRERSDRYRMEAVKRYRQIVSEHPDYARLDEVLYSLGSNLWEQDKRKAAVKVYQVLVKRFPQSDYVPDAWLSFGEYFFDEGEVRKALEAYKKAASFTDSKVYGFALYKQGWCYYNLAEWQQALDLFKAVIFYGDMATGLGGENKLALVREARRDYVLAYSHVGDPRNAQTEFQVVGGETWKPMLATLSNVYYDSGQDREAIVVYRDLIRDAPLAPETPGYQARIVDAAQRIGNKQYTVKQARLLVRLFEEVEEAGVIQTDEEKEDLEEARTFAEKTMRTLAVTWHAEAKKTRQDDTYRYAREMYEDYVTLFPDSEHAYDIHFYYGELLYRLEDFAGAASQYTEALVIDIDRIEGRRTAADGSPEKPGKFLTDAAFNAVLSYEEVARKFEEVEERPDAPPTEALDIPPAKQALLDACERYLQYVPGGEKQVEIRYKAANIYYRYNRFEEAVERFAVIALEHPEHELAEYSANLILDSYNLLDKPEKVNEWARRFYGDRRLAKGEFREELRQYIEDSALTMVEKLTEAGDHGGAARAYEDFVREFPRSERADTALYNASVSWAKAHDMDRALQLRARIITEYPKSDLVPQAIYSTAQGYEATVRFDEAARFYELYADRWAEGQGRRGRRGSDGPAFDEEKAQEGLFNSGVLREALGQYDQARRVRLEYVARWPEGKDASQLYASVADLLEKEGKVIGASRHLEDWLDRYAKTDLDQQLLVRLRQAELLERAGRRQQRVAEEKYAEILRIWDRLGGRRSQVKDGLRAVAVATLRSLEDDAARYRSIGLEYPWQEGVPAQRLTRVLETAQKIVAEAQEAGRESFTDAEIAKIRAAQKIQPRLERGIAVADKRFKASIQEKSQALQTLTERYGEVVKFKQGEPALCALSNMGRAYLHFVEALKNAPLPPYLHGEEQEMRFRDLMAEQALPIEDKAVEAFATAVQKSRELMLYDDCADESLQALKTLRPGDWPRLAEARLPLRDGTESRQGNFLLTQIQPEPEPAAAPAAEEALSGDARAEMPRSADRRPPPAGVRPISSSADRAGEPGEPDDEDLLQ